MITGPQGELGRSVRIEHESINLTTHQRISNVTNTKGNRLALSHSLLELVNQLQLPRHDGIPER